MTFDDFLVYFDGTEYGENRDNAIETYRRIYNDWVESGCANIYAGFPDEIQLELYKAYGLEVICQAVPDPHNWPDMKTLKIPSTIFLEILQNHNYDMCPRLINIANDRIKCMPEEFRTSIWLKTLALFMIFDLGLDKPVYPKVSENLYPHIFDKMAELYLEFATEEDEENPGECFVSVQNIVFGRFEYKKIMNEGIDEIIHSIMDEINNIRFK